LFFSKSASRKEIPGALRDMASEFKRFIMASISVWGRGKGLSRWSGRGGGRGEK
jgi:hypothetical protein